MIAAIIASLALGTLFYVLVGYPLLLNWWSRRFPRLVKRESIYPSVSIIIPAYNGEAFLSNKLDSILNLEYPSELIEVIVVSDGSTDRTESIAQAYASRGVRLLRVPRGGKPAALNAAIPLAHGEILVLTDVRQLLAPDSVRLLIESFADPSVGTVSGELIIGKGDTRESSDIGLYWRLETMMRDSLSQIDSMFGATGPFYAIRRELAVPIPEDSLLDDMYLPLAAFFRGYRLIMDARARAFDFPTSLEVEFNRKVRTLAGNYQILLAYPALLGSGNRMWLHFMSYKFGRLLLPWCLIALAIASFWLPDPWRWLLLACQAVTYLLAAIDLLVPSGPLKYLSSPARTFVTMMIAALRALSVFVIPARSLWKVTSASRP
ncbi:MAG TPA: glycosyltransferase family 2 protein [Bryobacteraceae bacterium]|jgi:biofilm PGA synthesis N-glycosyltransferase PgaC|nr:glycosyltransferase family 2 protein [Bryobacteraceae bacterium]